MFCTHCPLVPCTTHTCPAGQFIPVHGFAWQVPFSHTCPFGQVPVHGVWHVPFTHDCPDGQFTPKQGSVWQVGGVPVQICPVGHPNVLHVSSTHAPCLHLNPVGQFTLMHGSTHDALP